MKAGHFIIIGLVLWILLSIINSLWVFQSKGHIGAAIIVGLGSIVWLTNRENRQRFRTAFSSKGFDEHFLERLLNSLQVGLITFLSFFVIASEISKVFMRQSEGYNYIVSEVTKNKIIQDQIGEVKYIAIGNSFSAGVSFKDSEKRLRTNLTVFGVSGQVSVDVEVTKTDDWKIGDMKINN